MKKTLEGRARLMALDRLLESTRSGAGLPEDERSGSVNAELLDDEAEERNQ